MADILEYIFVESRAIDVIGGGMLVTIGVTLASILLGLIVGIPLAVARTYGNKFVQIIVQAYEGFFRGTPLVVVLFIFYFGLSGIGQLFGNPEFKIELSPVLAAVLSLGLICSAYLSMVFRGAIQSISKDQYDAARSLGMSKWKAIFNIILLQAFRLSIPGFTNEFTIVLKDSPITYVVAVPEMLTQASHLTAGGKVFFEILIPIMVLYFIMFVIANKLLGILDKKLKIPGFEVQ